MEDAHAFEDVMELDGMRRQPSVSGGRRKRDGSIDDTWDDEFVAKDGIMMSTTVEIRRSPKGDDGNHGIV